VIVKFNKEAYELKRGEPSKKSQTEAEIWLCLKGGKAKLWMTNPHSVWRKHQKDQVSERYWDSVYKRLEEEVKKTGEPASISIKISSVVVYRSTPSTEAVSLGHFKIEEKEFEEAHRDQRAYLNTGR
jgi:hypothetical protein